METPSQQLYLPQPLDKFVLAEDWTFNLEACYQNKKIGEHLNYWTAEHVHYSWGTWRTDLDAYPLTLPTNTVITMGCYRVKMGQNGCNHVTLRLTEPIKATIQVPLADLNRIRYLPYVDDFNSSSTNNDQNASEGDEVAAC